MYGQVLTDCLCSQSAAPALLSLGLDAAGLARLALEVDSRGNLVLDKYLRTSQKTIFAVGDCAGGMQFTHLAGYQGGVAAWSGFPLFFLRFSIETCRNCPFFRVF